MIFAILRTAVHLSPISDKPNCYIKEVKRTATARLVQLRLNHGAEPPKRTPCQPQAHDPQHGRIVPSRAHAVAVYGASGVAISPEIAPKFPPNCPEIAPYPMTKADQMWYNMGRLVKEVRRWQYADTAWATRPYRQS
jgi:hypothetical protein